jgi:hypothetical protein
MSATEKAKAAYRHYKTAKEHWDRYETVKEYYDMAMAALDEDTRSGALAKGGLKVSTAIAERLLGASLTSHPYFALHKAHFEVLATALDASSTHENARNALSLAVAAADRTARIKGILEGFMQRRNGLLFAWQWGLCGLLEMHEDYRRDPANAHAAVRSVGLTPDTLARQAEADLASWRSNWVLLVQEATQLSLMVGAEGRVAKQAIARYEEKMRKLEQGTLLGAVAAGGLKQERQWEEYNRSKPGSTAMPVEALRDPGGYAEKRWREVDSAVRRLVHACDIALGDGPVHDPSRVLRRLLDALGMA